jgi:hypothetical protein
VDESASLSLDTPVGFVNVSCPDAMTVRELGAAACLSVVYFVGQSVRGACVGTNAVVWATPAIPNAVPFAVRNGAVTAVLAPTALYLLDSRTGFSLYPQPTATLTTLTFEGADLRIVLPDVIEIRRWADGASTAWLGLVLIDSEGHRPVVVRVHKNSSSGSVNVDVLQISGTSMTSNPSPFARGCSKGVASVGTFTVDDDTFAAVVCAAGSSAATVVVVRLPPVDMRNTTVNVSASVGLNAIGGISCLAGELIAMGATNATLPNHNSPILWKCMDSALHTVATAAYSFSPVQQVRGLLVPRAVGIAADEVVTPLAVIAGAGGAVAGVGLVGNQCDPSTRPHAR